MAERIDLLHKPPFVRGLSVMYNKVDYSNIKTGHFSFLKDPYFFIDSFHSPEKEALLK